MNEYVERTGGSGLVVGLIALIVVAVVIGLLVMPGITGNLAEVQTQKTAAGHDEQLTLRTTADLRAEATARAQNIATMILTAGLMIVGGLLTGAGLIFGLNWYEGRQAARLAQQEAAATRNTLMILQAQMQRAPPAPYMQIESTQWANRPRPMAREAL